MWQELISYQCQSGNMAKAQFPWKAIIAGGVIAGEGLVGAIIVLFVAAKFFGVSRQARASGSGF